MERTTGTRRKDTHNENKISESKEKKTPDSPECESETDPYGGKYDLTDEEREWVVRTIDSLPPLSEEDREAIALLLQS